MPSPGFSETGPVACCPATDTYLPLAYILGLRQSARARLKGDAPFTFRGFRESSSAAAGRWHRARSWSGCRASGRCFPVISEGENRNVQFGGRRFGGQSAGDVGNAFHLPRREFGDAVEVLVRFKRPAFGDVGRADEAFGGDACQDFSEAFLSLFFQHIGIGTPPVWRVPPIPCRRSWRGHRPAAAVHCPCAASGGNAANCCP